MDLFAEIDNTTKNIIQELLKECSKKNLNIDEEFCRYYVKLLTLDPVWGISSHRKKDRIVLQTLVSWIIEKFSDLPKCLSLITIKMQQYFMTKYVKREKVIKDHYDLINSTAEPLLKSITDITVDNMQPNKSKILRRMTLYIVMVSKMGDVKNFLVFREAFYALKSIIDDDDLNNFIKMSKQERRNEIIYKQKVVMGIRLFNADCGRQTFVLADLPKIIQESAAVMQVEIQEELCYIMDIVNLTTTAIESVFEYNIPCENTVLTNRKIENLKVTVKLPDGTSYEDLERILNILVFARQHEVYLRKFLLDLKVIQKNVNTLVTYFKEILSKLHNSVKYKIAVIAATVYPLFMDLGELWISIQEEAIIFSNLIQVFKHLDECVKKVDIDKEKIELMIGNNPVMTDAMRLEKTTGTRIGQLFSTHCQILDPLEIEDFENLHLEFLGFCIWKFIFTNGALIPGNPNMGVIKWDNKYYVFSVPEAGVYFAQDPKKMIMRALTIARKKPELITLLQIHRQIYDIRNIEMQTLEGSVFKKNVLHKKIQTEIHPIAPYKDKTQGWNTWQMLKDATVLADICTRRTRSSQTKLSQFRCSTRAQTTLKKDKKGQTKMDNCTNTPVISQFQYGLRGRKEDFQHRVELTRPIEEKIFYRCATANPSSFRYEKRGCSAWTTNKPIKKSNNKKSSPFEKKNEDSIKIGYDFLSVCQLNRN